MADVGARMKRRALWFGGEGSLRTHRLYDHSYGLKSTPLVLIRPTCEKELPLSSVLTSTHLHEDTLGQNQRLLL